MHSQKSQKNRKLISTTSEAKKTHEQNSEWTRVRFESGNEMETTMQNCYLIILWASEATYTYIVPPSGSVMYRWQQEENYECQTAQPMTEHTESSFGTNGEFAKLANMPYQHDSTHICVRVRQQWEERSHAFEKRLPKIDDISHECEYVEKMRQVREGSGESGNADDTRLANGITNEEIKLYLILKQNNWASEWVRVRLRFGFLFSPSIGFGCAHLFRMDAGRCEMLIFDWNAMYNREWHCAALKCSQLKERSSWCEVECGEMPNAERRNKDVSNFSMRLFAVEIGYTLNRFHYCWLAGWRVPLELDDGTKQHIRWI